MAILYLKTKLIMRPVFLGLWLMCIATTVVAADDVIYKIKSVYIYNFLSFIQWPEPQESMTEYQLCMVAEHALISKLRAVVQNETMNGLPLSVVAYNAESQVADCHLLFIQENMNLQADVLEEVQHSQVLLVGDAPNFVSEGFGMVGFETRGRKVRVAMNLTRLQDAGFKVSSKLLRVVRIVR